MPEIVPSPPVERIARQTWLAHVGDQGAFNRELAKILADAAAEAERIVATTIGDGIGAEVRRAQYKIAIAQLQQLSTQMWGGQIDPLISSHIALSTERAVDGLLAIDRVLASSLANPALRDGFLAASRRGADNVRSRLLNNINLSPQVYRTEALANRWVAQEINRGIALNKSAKEIARSVRRFIRPNVPGGVSYAAQRLGRTELNNAFHTTTIRASADQPWMLGFKWNTSGSHPKPDECDEFAERDHDNLGAGVFEKGNVPGKPHPQCLCYITTISVSDEEFIESLATGKYDRYLDDQGFANFGEAVNETLPFKLFASNADGAEWGNSQFATWQASQSRDVQNAIHRYTSGTSSVYNRALRGDGYPLSVEQADSAKLIAKALHEGKFTEGATLTRGANMRGDFSVGSEWYDPGFLSTSAGPSSAWDANQFIFKIEVPEGSSGGYLGEMSGFGDLQAEVLLPPGNRFAVTAVAPHESGATQVTMRLIKQDSLQDNIAAIDKATG